MPWNPDIQYHGDQYLYNGITGAANVISDDLVKTLQKLDEQKKVNAFNDVMKDKLSTIKDPTGAPYIPADALLRYEQAGPTQRTGIVQGAMASAQLDAERQKAASDAAAKAAETNYYGAHAAYMNTRAASEGQDSGGVQIQPYTDPVSNKPVPGMGIVKGPGNQFQIVDKSGLMGGGVKVEKDPQSGALFYRDARGNPRPISQGDVVGGQIAAAAGSSSPQSPPPTPAQSAPPGKVRVKGPDGNLYLVPAEQLQQAITKGAVLLP